MTNTSDELDTAVAAAAQGDRTALALVLENIRPMVVRYCAAVEWVRPREDTCPLTTSHRKSVWP